MVYSNHEVGEQMKPLKDKVSITLDGDVVERIKQLADNDDRSFSQYINMVLKEHLNKTKNFEGTAGKQSFFNLSCSSSDKEEIISAATVLENTPLSRQSFISSVRLRSIASARFKFVFDVPSWDAISERDI